MRNRLKDEVSPYLLQHAENPVDWYPWCEEAFQRAREENKPVFLSVGYSTCHWCHVMAHESFEDENTAEILNRDFISIKVDREERPDIDSVYMAACQAFTGSGGWPMSVFMTWDKKPFFAGTYFPPRPRGGMPGFPQLLGEIASLWKNSRDKLLDAGTSIADQLKAAEAPEHGDGGDMAEKAARMLERRFDGIHGGFGSAPKFPTPHNLLFLTLYAGIHHRPELLKMAEKTLLQMRKGGIFDHIGWGFSRYSTDKYFLVPHFEKMLYDNALIIIACCGAYSGGNDPVHLDTAKKTAEYVLREMTAPDGGFYSAQDADSDGVEGKYYTFTPDEVINVLGSESGENFCRAFDITARGNFEGLSIPNLLKSGDLSGDFCSDIKKLYDYRLKRTKLHLDDKILLSWNALMITALAVLYRLTRDPVHLHAAERAQRFIDDKLTRDGRLYRSCRQGRLSCPGFLDDYAFAAAALIELYSSTLEKAYLERAQHLCNDAVRLFRGGESGGYHLCPTDSGELFMNPRETYDGAIPSGNSAMAWVLTRLYQLTEDEKYRQLFLEQETFMSAAAADYPSGSCMFLAAKLIYENPPQRIVIALPHGEDKGSVIQDLPFFASVSMAENDGRYPLLNCRSTYYVCRGNTCLPPTNTLH